MAVPDDARATIVADLAEQTGKTLEPWIVVVAAKQLQEHGGIAWRLA